MTLNTALGPAPLPRQGCQVDSIGRRLGALSARYPDDPEYPRKDRPYERIPSFGMIPSLRVCLLSKGREPDVGEPVVLRINKPELLRTGCLNSRR